MSSAPSPPSPGMHRTVTGAVPSAARLRSPSGYSLYQSAASTTGYGYSVHTRVASYGNTPTGTLNNTRSQSTISSSSSSSSSPRVPTPSRRQGWREWAGDKLNKAKARGAELGLLGASGPGQSRAPGPYGQLPSASASASSSAPGSDVTEVITLFPGWATRRYANRDPEQHLDPSAPIPFEVEVSASGYAISYRNRDTMTRSHRAFIRLAKGFAALPKLVSESNTPPTPPKPSQVNPQLSASTEELLAQAGPIHLPPRPDEIDAAYDAAYREENNDYSRLSEQTSTPNSPRPRGVLNSAAAPKAVQPQEFPPTEPSPADTLTGLTADAINRLHVNLEERLKPFWSSVVANRIVRVHLFASPSGNHDSHLDGLDDETYWDYNKPLATTEVTTTADGSFQAKFVIGWDQLCHHPRALHIAFGGREDKDLEHDVVVVAELTDQIPEPVSVPYASYTSPRRAALNANQPTPTTKTQIHIPISHSPIRVISDIDDTVKKSGILFGARAVFYNVFVKDLQECVIPGMGEWYTEMWKRGVRFHYVSNGPFEYISVLNEYFPLSQLPPGSVKLKSYARRSLFNGLMTSAAGRKRAGVEEVLDAFPDSRFFLIGDSGEQDLELYAELAQKRPSNILGVFIRDVSTVEGVTDPIDDPTGWHALVAHASLQNTAGLDQVGTTNDGDTDSIHSRRSSISERSVGEGGPRRSMTDLLISVGRKSSSISSFLAFKGKNTQDGSTKYDSDDEAVGSDLEAGRSTNSERRRSIASDWDEDADATPMANNVSRFISEAPKPTPPPSIRKRSRTSSTATSASSSSAGIALAAVASRRSQRAGDTASSVSVSSSSSLSAQSFSAFSQSGGGSEAGGPTSNPVSLQAAFQAKVDKMTRVMANATTAEDKRRAEIQLRVWRARTVIPAHVALRLFRHPEECAEVKEILDRELETGVFGVAPGAH